MNPNKDQNPRQTIPEGLGYGSEPEANTPPPDTPNEPAQPEAPASDPFDIDDLARETDEKFKIPADSDKFEEDLGWGEPEGGGSKPEAGADDPDPNEPGDDPETPKDDEDEHEDDDPEPDDEPTDDPAPDEQEDDDESGADDEPFYSEERDFPAEDGRAKVAGTVYKDRVKLNDGVAAKINHVRKLKKQLEENEAGLGAIRLPELFQGDEEYIDRPFDRASFVDMDDDGAKKAAYELDRFIKDVNGKIDSVTQARQHAAQEQEVSEEYSNALNQLAKDLEFMGMDLQKANAMQLNTLFSKIDEQISGFEGDKGQEYVDEHGIKAYNARMRQMEEARNRIKKFPEVAARQKELQQKGASTPSAADPEKVKSAYRETRQDRPDHAVFESKQKENAFLEWVENEVYQGRKTPAETPREWVKFADEYEDLVQEEYRKYEASKAQADTASGKPDDTPADPESGKRADRTGKQKPAPEEISTDKKRRQDADKLTVDQIDNELDRLAQETERRLNS